MTGHPGRLPMPTARTLSLLVAFLLSLLSGWVEPVVADDSPWTESTQRAFENLKVPAGLSKAIVAGEP